MNYVIIILLIILIILTILSLLKNINEANITERLGKLEVQLLKEMGDFKNDLNKNLGEDFDKLNEQVEKRLLLINEKVNERLDQNFEKTNKTFMNVLERLSKIDEAQKKIESLSLDIVSLQSILTDKKTRGIFGEVTLKQILVSVFGEGNNSIYRLQYTLSNGFIAILFCLLQNHWELYVLIQNFLLSITKLWLIRNNLWRTERKQKNYLDKI